MGALLTSLRRASPLLSPYSSEQLAEDSTFPHHELASLIASKIFYHLEEHEDALRHALAAGSAFDPLDGTEYAHAIVARCIDDYAKIQRQEFEAQAHAAVQQASALSGITRGDAAAPLPSASAERKEDNDEEDEDAQSEAKSSEAIPVDDVMADKPESAKRSAAAAPAQPTHTADPRLVALVERLLQESLNAGLAPQVIGLALDTFRLDVVRNAVLNSSDKLAMMDHVFALSRSIKDKRYRERILSLLVELHLENNRDVGAASDSSALALAECFFELKSPALAALLEGLVAGKETRRHLLAYQIAFDMVENQNRPYNMKICNLIKGSATVEDDDEQGSSSSASASASASASSSGSAPDTSTFNGRVQVLKDILSGRLSADLYLHFLYSNCRPTALVPTDGRDPINIFAHFIAASYSKAGTTRSEYLNTASNHLSKLSGWSKFSVTASLGTVHRGQYKVARQLLASFLPPARASARGSVPASLAAQEGGALYGLGLMCAGYTDEHTPYLKEMLLNAGESEVIAHGAALGLGLSAVGTADQEIYTILRDVIYSERTIPAEAAAYAVGLVMMGSGDDEAIVELLRYARSTKREKVTRAIAIGLALVVYGREQFADVLIEDMTSDKDPYIRMGGVLAIGMAYAATGNNAALRKLLNLGVTDGDMNVRRNAVTAIGFVLLADPEQVPKTVGLLSESYNIHVRYGACLAMGIACAGKGQSIPEAYRLLAARLTDRSHVVEQAALISMAMLMMQCNDKNTIPENSPAVTDGVVDIKIPKSTPPDTVADSLLRKHITAETPRLSRKDLTARISYYLASGILGAGGHNVAISMISPTGRKRMVAIAGMALFTQFWFWYPLLNMLPLAFAPTALIGLDSELRKPSSWKIGCNAPASRFAYPAKVNVIVEQKVQERVVNVLSVSGAQARRRRQQADDPALSRQGSLSLTRQGSAASTLVRSASQAKLYEEGKKAEEKKDPIETTKAWKKTEPKVSILTAPCRIVPQQGQYLLMAPNQRYVPIKSKITGPGIVLLQDTRPEEAAQLVKESAPNEMTPGFAQDEPRAPAPFVITDFEETSAPATGDDERGL